MGLIKFVAVVVLILGLIFYPSITILLIKKVALLVWSILGQIFGGG